MSDLAQAYVQIMPSAEGISGSLSDLLSGEAGRAGTESGEAVGNNLVSSLKGIVAAAGIGTAVKAAIGAVDGLAKAGDTIDKSSQKMGVSAEQYQAMAFAAEHCGFSTSTFSQAVRKLQSSGYDGTISDYMNGLMAIEDPAERAAKAQEDLGSKVAMEMAAFINGGKSLDEYGAQLSDLGGMMSNESVAASAAYADAMTDMHAAIDGVKMNLLGGLIPVFSEVINGVAMLASGDGEGLSMITDAIGGVIQGIIDAIPDILSAGAELVLGFVNYLGENLPTFVSQGFEIVSGIVSGIIQGFPGAVSSAASFVASFAAGIGSNLPQMLEQGLLLLGEVLAGVIQAIPQIPGYILDVCSSIIEAFSGTDWGSVGKSIIDGIARGLSGAVGTIIEAAKQAAKSALDAAKNFLGIHSPSRVFRDEVGAMIGEGMALGIEDEVNAVKGAVGTLSSASISAVGAENTARPDIDTMIRIMYRMCDLLEERQTVGFDTRDFRRAVRANA